jgi:hypothetical protein
MNRGLFPTSQTRMDEVGPDVSLQAGAASSRADVRPGSDTPTAQRGRPVATTED